MKCPKCNTEMKELSYFLHHVKCENCEYEEEDIFIRNEGGKRKYVKFKPNDKLICKTDAYSTINKGDIVTVTDYIEYGFFFIKENVGVYEDIDFIQVK